MSVPSIDQDHPGWVVFSRLHRILHLVRHPEMVIELGDAEYEAVNDWVQTEGRYHLKWLEDPTPGEPLELREIFGVPVRRVEAPSYLHVRKP